MILRDRLVSLLAQGKSESEILSILKIPKTRLDQELERIDETVHLWLEHLAKRGYLMKYQAAIQILEKNMTGLQKTIKVLHEKVIHSHPEYAIAEIRAREALTEAIAQHWKLLDQAPMVNAFQALHQKSLSKQDQKLMRFRST